MTILQCCDIIYIYSYCRKTAGSVIPSDFSALLALEYDGEFVRIKDAENKGGLKDVSLHLEYEGKRIKDMPAGSHTEFYFPEMQKGAICYLQIMHFGKPLRVSNIIEF